VIYHSQIDSLYIYLFLGIDIH